VRAHFARRARRKISSHDEAHHHQSSPTITDHQPIIVSSTDYSIILWTHNAFFITSPIFRSTAEAFVDLIFLNPLHLKSGSASSIAHFYSAQQQIDTRLFHRRGQREETIFLKIKYGKKKAKVYHGRQ
jgi:hypothetical protein